MSADIDVEAAHFSVRARERGFTGDVGALHDRIVRELAAGRDDIHAGGVERVFRTLSGDWVCRVLTGDGLFYPVVSDRTGLPMTLYAPGMMVRKQNGRFRRLSSCGGLSIGDGVSA